MEASIDSQLYSQVQTQYLLRTSRSNCVLSC